jgi:hypothetical protein
MKSFLADNGLMLSTVLGVFFLDIRPSLIAVGVLIVFDFIFGIMASCKKKDTNYLRENERYNYKGNGLCVCNYICTPLRVISYNLYTAG